MKQMGELQIKNASTSMIFSHTLASMENIKSY